MNLLEGVSWVIAAFIVFFFARKAKIKTKPALLIALALMPVLWMAIAETSQFLTTDELYVIREPLFVNQTRLFAWSLHDLQTTIVLLAPVFNALKWMSDLSEVKLLALGKILHWFTGLIAFIGLGLAVTRAYAPKKRQAVFFLFLLWVVFALPTDLIAIRIFNYDLLSLALGVLGFFLTVNALLDEDRGTAAWGIFFSSLAAQEKLSASPLLMLSLAGYIWVQRPRNFAGSLVATGKALGISCAVFLATCASLVACLKHAPPPMSPKFLLYPLISWVLPVFTTYSMGGSADYPTQVLLIPFILLTGFAVLAPVLKKAVKKVSWVEIFETLDLVLVGIVFIMGIYGALGMPTYWVTPDAVPKDVFLPKLHFNGMVKHFDSRSALEHHLKYIAYACANFVEAAPWVSWLGIVALASRRVRKSLPAQSYLSLLVTLALALFFPVMFGVTETPVGNKYLDISMLLYLCVSCVGFFLFVSKWDERRAYAAMTVWALVFFAEVLPYGPLYAAFRPFGVSPGDALYKSKPIPPSLQYLYWHGWGEEAMIAGKRIAERCESSGGCQGVRVYCAYAGEWLLHPSEIDVRCSAPWWDRDLRYTDRDYYVLNRAIVTVVGPFPGVEPIDTITYNGYTQAWIFRGDQLAAVNFQMKAYFMH